MTPARAAVRARVPVVCKASLQSHAASLALAGLIALVGMACALKSFEATVFSRLMYATGAILSLLSLRALTTMAPGFWHLQGGPALPALAENTSKEIEAEMMATISARQNDK